MPGLPQAATRLEDKVEHGKRNTQRVRPLDHSMASDTREDSIQS